MVGRSAAVSRSPTGQEPSSSFLTRSSQSRHWLRFLTVCIIHTMQSRELIKLLQSDG